MGENQVAAAIRNRNTREAYYRAACSLFAWLEQHEIAELADIKPMLVPFVFSDPVAWALGGPVPP